MRYLISVLLTVMVFVGGYSVHIWQRHSSLEKELSLKVAQLDSMKIADQELEQAFKAQVDSLHIIFQARSDSIQYKLNLRMEDLAKEKRAIKKNSDWLASAKKKEEGEFHKVFENLMPYKKGDNPVESEYVKSFSIKPKPKDKNGFYYYDIRVRLENETDEPIQPDYEIVFVNTYGFITGGHRDSWSWNEIDPEEVQYHDGEMHKFKYGDPAYYFVELH